MVTSRSAALEPGPGEVRGLVLTLEGTPAAAEVLVGPVPNPVSTNRETGEQVRQTSCDERGAFSVAGLSFGVYSVTARFRDAYAVKRINLRRHEETAEVLLVLYPGKPLSGTVTTEWGEPIERARLLPLLRDGERLPAADCEPLAVVSERDGTFSFPALEPRSWEIYVKADGFAPLLTDPIPVDSTGHVIRLQEGVLLTGIALDANDGAPIQGLWIVATPRNLDVEGVRDATGADGSFALPPLGIGRFVVDVASEELVLVGGPVEVTVDTSSVPGPITLRVRSGGIVRGRLVDGDTGEGISGVQVRARPKNRLARIVDALPTSEDGEFELKGLAEGEYTIAPSGVRGYPHGGHSREVSVFPGEIIEGIEIQMVRGPYVAGLVVDADGAPRAGAEVRYSDERGGMQSRVFSGSDGQFFVAGLEPDSSVTLSAHTPAATSQEVVVSSNGTQDVILALTIDSSASISGIVVDRQGRPIRVELFGRGANNPLGGFLFLNTTFDGKFFVTGLSADVYTIVGRHKGGNSVELATINVAAGQAATNQRLVFPVETYSISGTVVASNGAPISASLSLSQFIQAAPMPAGVPQPVGGTSMPPAFAHSRHDGTFTADGLVAGTYHITASAKGYEPQTVEAEAGAQNVAITLEAQGNLEGRVLDAATKRPLTEFQIAAVRSGSLPQGGIPGSQQFQRVSDPDGLFSLALESYSYDIFVRAIGYQLATRRAGVSPDLRREIVFELQPGDIRVSGIVVDVSGKEISGAAVFVGPLPQFPQVFMRQAAARSAVNGEFEIAGLAEGSVTLSAFEPSHGVGSVTEEAGGNRTGRLVITLLGSASISGRILSGGEVVLSAAVRVDTQSGARHRTVSDAEGGYIISGVEPGTATVTVEAPATLGADAALQTITEQVDLDVGETLRLDFEFGVS